MNSKLLTAFLVVASLSSGCIIHNENHGGGGGVPPPQHVAQPGDVTVSWSFAGATCSDVPQVQKVVINIPGETLENAGTYSCLVANYPGIVLHNFAGGAYTFTIDALGYDNKTLYTGSGSFTVDGSVRVNIDLTPVNAPTSYAYLTWTFPANSLSTNPTCAQAGANGISKVDVTIDSITETVDCSLGQSAQGYTTPYLNAGTHNITIVARDASGYAYYAYDGTLQTFNGNPASGNYGLLWAVGGASVKWTLIDGSTVVTCTQAGVTNVGVNFQDMNGKWLYADSANNPVDDVQPCNPGQGAVTYDYLPPGQYHVWVGAAGANNSAFASATPGPIVTVNAGSFPTAQQALNVSVTRYQ
ncbi:MAG: hypothetical protein ACJ790_03435 [Myxococcaceae bacterium]